MYMYVGGPINFKYKKNKVTYPQEGSQHQGLSDCRIKSIRNEGACVNEKSLFPVQEPPGGFDSSRS